MRQLSSTLLLSVSAITLLSAAAAAAQTATATAVHSFTGPDGTAPSSIIQASDGNLWGTAAQGGLLGDGIIFKIYPDGTFVTVYDFASGSYPTAGAQPISLIEGNDGNFYGLTQAGGDGTARDEPYCQCGTFFRITPSGQLTGLFSFGDGSGAYPNPGLLQGSDGNFYSTNEYGITVFSPAGTLLNFSLVSTKPIVASGMLQHTNGTFYGATDSYGVVYTYTLQQGVGLHNGYGGLGLGYTFAEGTDGNIYGAGNDIAFHFSPGGTYKTFTTDFDAATGLASASDGNVYGMYGSGTIAPLFNITPAGQVHAIATTGGPEITNTSSLFRITPIQASDGSFLATFAEYGTSVDAIYRYTLSPALPAPIQLTTSESTIALGSSFTLNWQVLNASSATLRQCNAFLSRPGTGGGDWSGLQSGTFSGNVYSGSATITPTAGGTYTYALTCGGLQSGYSAVVSVTGGSASASSTLLQTSAPSVKAGSPITLSATVTSNTGGYQPTGAVTFNYGSLTLATVSLNAHGTASFTASTANLPGGTYGITAHYAGDANDLASVSPVVPVIVQGVTAATLVISPATFAVGGSATLTATVRDIHGGTVPTGTVQFYYTGQDTSNSFGSATLNSAGVATVTTPANPVLAAGSYAVTADYYLGDTYNQPTTSPAVTLYVTSATSTALTAYPTSVTDGQYVTFTATVTGPSNAVVSNGTVTFTSGSITAATATVNSSGVASATVLVQNIPAGTYPVVANYKGTTVYAPSTSAAVNVTVTQ